MAIKVKRPELSGTDGAASAAGQTPKYGKAPFPDVSLPDGELTYLPEHFARMEDVKSVHEAVRKPALPDDDSGYTTFPVDVTITLRGLKAAGSDDDALYTSKDRNARLIDRIDSWDSMHERNFRGLSAERCSDLQNWTWDCCGEQVGSDGCVKRSRHATSYRSDDY